MRVEGVLLRLILAACALAATAAAQEPTPTPVPKATPPEAGEAAARPVAAEPTPVPEPPAAVGEAAGPDAPRSEDTAGPQADADLEAEVAAVTARIDALAGELADVVPGSSDADRLDAELVAFLEREQAALDAALDRLGRARGVADDDPRWRRVELHGEALLELVDLRTRSRETASEQRRHELLTLGREGVAQLGRELRTLSLAARYHLASRRHALEEAPRLARDIFTVGAALSRLLLVLAVLAAALWVRRRWRSWLEKLRGASFRSLAGIAAKRRAQRLFGALETIAPWALFLLTLAALRWALGAAAETAELNALLMLLGIWGWYRLAIDALAAVLVSVAVHYGLDASGERRAMLLRSVRTVLRVAVVLVLITLVSKGMGQGFLSMLVLRLGWVLVLAAVLVELFRWRAVMIDTFLKLQPSGRLAARMRATRSRWTGALLAPVAFLWLAGRGAATVAREFALGFEQTQKALAFLFRRKVERQAERQGYAEGDVGELPEAVVEAFDEAAVDRGPLVLPYFPGLEELHEIISGWRDSGGRGSFLLTGERGVGKSSWLNQLRREDVEITRIELGRRITGPAELADRLAELLGVGLERGGDIHELGRALADGPQRLVVLDLAQHLFIADVGGYEAFGAFAGLVNRSCRTVFWLSSMSGYAWRHLRAVRPDATVFRTRQHLAGWDDERIASLIRTRCAASGVRFNYADLAVEKLEGVEVRSRLIESEEGYLRLLWDYSDGNPRSALHFFLRSLDPERADRVRVRLFKAPEVELLEAGGFDGLFMLAAVITHESISVEDLMRVTRFGRTQCFIHLDRLQEIGAVAIEEGMVRITTSWHRAAVRLLRRRNLLPA